jgi:hypothetical protein
LNAEVRKIIADQHWNIEALGDRMGIYGSNVHRLLKQNHIQENFIKLLDALGYDIEVKFVRKRSRYGRQAAPEGFERLSKKQAEDLIEKLQAYVDGKE